MSNKHFFYKFENFAWYDNFIYMWFYYHSIFFGSLIFRGRKIAAFNLFLNVKEGLKLAEDFDPYVVFLSAMFKITPEIVLFPITRFGRIVEIPFPISERKRFIFAAKWVIKLLKASNRVVSVSSIVDLLVSAIYSRGLSFQKKLSVYAVASSNRHTIRFIR